MPAPVAARPAVSLVHGGNGPHSGYPVPVGDRGGTQELSRPAEGEPTAPYGNARRWCQRRGSHELTL